MGGSYRLEHRVSAWSAALASSDQGLSLVAADAGEHPVITWTAEIRETRRPVGRATGGAGACLAGLVSPLCDILDGQSGAKSPSTPRHLLDVIHIEHLLEIAWL